MHPDLTKEMLDVLIDEGQLSLPGFGTFRLRNQPASVSTIDGKSRPPGKIVEFNANLKLNDGRLERYLREELSLGDQSQTRIDEFISSLSSEIEAGKMITLAGIGRLFRDHTGELRFTAGDNNLSKDSFGLPDVSLSPITRTERAPVVDPVSSPTVKSTIARPSSMEELQSEPEPLTQLWGLVRENILAIVICTVVICLAGLYYIQSRDNSRQELARMERQTPPPPNDRLNVPPPPPASVIPGITLPPDEPEELPEAQPNPPTVNQAPPATNLPPEEGLAIIGLYRLGKEANVRKNVLKISEAGYEPYTSESNQLTRVGIQVRFKSEQELDNILRQIRQEFTQDAFILEKNGQRYKQ